VKKSIWVVISLLVLVAAFPLASQAAPLQKLSWRAEYFDNPSLSGQPRLVVYESKFGHDWGYGSPSPEIPVDHFSARFTRTMHFDKGTYLFTLSVDDGARVWLDGNLIIDSWSVGRKDKVQVKVRIDETGDHEVQVAYFEHVGAARVHLDWLLMAGEDDILGAWVGDYFDNRHLQGNPVMTRQDSGINFDWNSGSPAAKVPRDNFSVRWTRSIYLQAGHYTFRVQHDDGMRVYIDGKIIYDSWYDQELSYEVGIVPIKEGYRTITVEYYDHVGNAVVHFSIDEDPGDYSDTIPNPSEPGVYVDNGDPGFIWFGPAPAVGRGGVGGDFFWTHNKSSKPVNTAMWKPNLPSDGNYEVFAYIPSDRSTTGSASYRIQHFGRVAERTLNQARFNNEYASLGTYYFDGKGNEFIVLDDATGEAHGSTQIVFDAIRLVKR
jgi:hypothetical protein